MTLSIPDSAKREKLGVLLLHGFTSALDTVSGLIPYLVLLSTRHCLKTGHFFGN